MKKTKLMTLGFLLLISIFIALYYGSIKHTSYVSEGVIDVGPYLNNGEVIALDGMWSFYPDELLEPSDFRNEGQSGTNSLQVPLAWGKAENAKSRGCGTYRLVLNNLEPNKQYGLIKKNIRIASKIFIDGRLLFQDGVPAVNEHGETMGNMPGIIGFESMDSTAEIIIQTSNFKYYSGGIVESIRLGSIADAEQECRENIIFDTMILTIITVIGVLLTILVVFFREFRKEEPEGYYLPITVLSFGIVNGALGERVIKLIVPGISTELLIRIEYVAVSLMLISLFLIIHVMDKRLLPKIGVYVLSLVYGVFLIAAIFSPMRYHLLWTLVSAATILVLPLLLVWVVYQFVAGRNLAIDVNEHAMLIGVLYFMNVYNLDVLLFTMGLKDNMKLAFLSSVFYGFIWFVLIAVRVNATNRKLIETEQELKMTNDELEVHRNQILAAYEHLEIQVMERTQELTQANAMLKIEVEQRQKNEEQIEKLAFYDQLTNLPNRRYFYDYMNKEIENGLRYGAAFTLLFLDLDGFKAVNDTFGHDVGDLLLQLVGKNLKDMVRVGDFVARLGGDEFVILLSNVADDASSKKICDKIITTLSEPTSIKDHTVNIGVSIGVAYFPTHGKTSNALVKSADNAMYVAKENGKNRYVFAAL